MSSPYFAHRSDGRKSQPLHFRDHTGFFCLIDVMGRALPRVSQALTNLDPMKTYKTLIVFLAAAAVVLTSITTADAQRTRTVVSEGAGRLVVWRSPGLGRNVIVGVMVDGRHVADLTYGNHYDKPVSAGRHVVAVQAFPRAYPLPPYSVEINVRPGQLYNFTAKGGVQQLVLK
jgi:hypothetical protein